MDIKSLVSEMLATGITQKNLALRVQCSQSLISALFNGKRGGRVSYEIADRLRTLHGELCADGCPSAAPQSKQPQEAA